MTGIAINRLHWPVDVLGPGRRVGIWVQGCSIGCPGCVSRDTWPPLNPHDRIATSELMDRINALVDSGPAGPIDGVTVTGGEPFDQADALEGLLTSLRGWLDQRGAPSADLLVYTGYDEPDARRLAPQAFELADAVIVGPYRAGEPGSRWWGSGNQRLVLRNKQQSARYEGAELEAAAELQVAVDQGQVFIVGIPSRRALARVESRLADSGVRLGGVSWRP